MAAMVTRLQIDRDKLAAFCRRNRIRKPAFFGSVLRGDFTARGDIDVLVEFEHGAEAGLLGMAGLELADLPGRNTSTD